MPDFSPAPEVASVAKDLIPLYHQRLTLPGVRVEYVFRSDTPKKNGKIVLGTARIISSLAAYLAGSDDDKVEGMTGTPFFVITITKPEWDFANAKQRRALVDHELCHCCACMDEKQDGTEELKLSIRAHDVEEFSEIVERHGIWKRDLRTFQKSMEGAQESFTFVAPEKPS